MSYTYAMVGVTACLLGWAPVDMIPAEQPAKSKPAARADRWESWRSLVGTWEGPSEGRPGKGTVQLVIGFIMHERFLKIATTADYKTDKGGEHHEDFGFVSFDRGRSRYVFRQFHSEGFVNQYTLTGDPKAGGKLELTTESCENTPPGWRARETYQLVGETLKHTFELAPPGKPFERYTTATVSRKKK